MFVCVQDISVSEEPSTDQTDLSASSPPPYVPPPPLPLSDITTHEAQDRLSHSDEGGQEGGATFDFDEKEAAVEDLSRADHVDTHLEVQDSHMDPGTTTTQVFREEPPNIVNDMDI